jgi:hypothetical protein
MAYILYLTFWGKLRPYQSNTNRCNHLEKKTKFALNLSLRFALNLSLLSLHQIEYVVIMIGVACSEGKTMQFTNRILWHIAMTKCIFWNYTGIGLGDISIFWFNAIFSIAIIVSKVETWATIYRNYRHGRKLSWYCFAYVHKILKKSFNS